MVARGLLAAALAVSCALATDVATFGDLAAVNAAGGSADVGAATIAFDDTLNVTTSLAVAGGGVATLDGNGRTLFRVVAGGTLELARLSITGAVGDAVAVEADGFVRLSRVAVFGNVGGAPLAVVDGSATVAFSSFYDNVNWAGVGGGAVSFLSAGGGRSLSVANSTFCNNSALDGGALFAATGPDETALGPLANASRDVVRVENASFEGNWAPYRGGSIVGGGATLGGFQSRGETPRASAADWVVAGNYRPYFGGGLLVTCAATFEGLVLDGNAADCVFVGNSAGDGGGGGVAARQGGLVCANCTFAGNDAADGGAALLEARRRTPEGAAFFANVARADGGALALGAGGPEVHVRGRAAFERNVAGGDGGAVHYLSAALVRLGGAGARRLDDAAYAYAYDAYAYEAPYDIPGNKTLEDFVDFFGASTYLFSAGTASQSRRVCLEPGSYAAVLQSDGGYGWAGEVFSVVAGRDAVVEATVPYLGVGITTTFDVAFFGDQAGAALAFVGNGAGGAGGAVAVEAYGSVFAEDCVFANNTARAGGGLAVRAAAGGAVVGGAFVGNAAAAGGGVGAVYSDALPLKLSAANAAAAGGGLDAVASDVRVDACAFEGNAAAGDGGALADASSTVVIDGGNATAPDADTSGATHFRFEANRFFEIASTGGFYVVGPETWISGQLVYIQQLCAPPGDYVLSAYDLHLKRASTARSSPSAGGAETALDGADFVNGTVASKPFVVPARAATSLADNTAGAAGGGLYHETAAAPPGFGATRRSGNGAGGYGDDAATPPRSMVRATNGSCESPWNSARPNPCPLAFAIYDAYGALATSAEAAVAVDADAWSGAQLKNSDAPFVGGVAALATMTITDAPGSPVNVTATASCLPGEAIVEGRRCVPCPPGTYNTAPGGACVTTACDDDGFECDAPGRSIETLPLEKGYMRQRDDSEKPIACVGLARNELNCPGGVAAGCAAEGHGEGATCSVCAGRYFFDVERATCEKCGTTLSDAAPATVASIVLILVGFALLLYLLVFMAGSTKDVKKTGKLGRLRNKLKAKWKIVFVGFNIMASMPAMLPEVTYPRMYGDMLKSIDFLKLDIGASLPLTCLPTSGGGHYQTLLFMTLAPLVVIALVLALSLVREVRGAAPPNLATSLVSVTVLVTYLVLPAVTTTIFRTLDCVELDDPKTAGAAKFLRAHYPTRRPRPGPSPREADLSVVHLQLLYGPYEPAYYLWEVFEMGRRLCATSLLLAFDGPISKLYFSIFLGLLTVKMYAYFSPFISDSDDTLAETINYVVVFMFLGALSAFLQAFDSQLDYFFIAINLMCVVIILALCYSDINREKAALKFALGEARELHKSLSRRFSSSKLGDDLGPGDEAAEAAPEAPDREPPGAAPGAAEAVTITELVVDGVALASTDGDQRHCGAPYGCDAQLSCAAWLGEDDA
ncbi:serine-type peptidase [Aureococcus anophagefferens]|nr:serine-type peptidase [Aureococcus anophagefferens]